MCALDRGANPFLCAQEDGQSLVTKAAIEPVWYLPGVAERFGCSEVRGYDGHARRHLS